MLTITYSVSGSGEIVSTVVDQSDRTTAGRMDTAYLLKLLRRGEGGRLMQLS